MITLGYHTCKSNGGKDFVRENGPFLAVYDENKNSIQFLGEGYYFWDNNLDLAHEWGRIRCGNSYFIIALEILINTESCFDLVGCMEHLNFLRKTISDLANRGIDRKNWPISKIIEYLKGLAKLDPTVFPFEAIRAVDQAKPRHIKREIANFVQHRGSYTVLNPKIVICLLEKESVLLRSQKRIIDPKR